MTVKEVASELKHKPGDVFNVDYSHIHWFHSDNTRVTSGKGIVGGDFGDPLVDLDAAMKTETEREDKKELRGGLVRSMFRGWDAKQGAVEVEFATKAQQDAAVKERKALIAEWRKTAETRGLADTAEEIWFPDGKPAPVVFVANMSYRRAYAIPGAIHRRKVTLPDWTGDYSYPITVKLVQYDDPRDRIIQHTLENLGKDENRLQYSYLSFLKTGVKIAEIPSSIENDLLRAGMSVGTKQQIWRFIQLDKMYRSLGGKTSLIERAFMEPNVKDKKPVYVAGGWIKADSLGKEEIYKLLKGKAWDSDGSEKNAPTAEVTPEYIESFIKAKMQREGGNAPKMLKKERIEALGNLKDPDACKLLASVCDAIVSGHEKYFDAFTPKVCEEVNKALEAIAKKHKLYRH
jgi:hypothetical protein